jgi:hypothetical protein
VAGGTSDASDGASAGTPVHSRKLLQFEQKTAPAGLIVWHFVQRITRPSPLACGP